MKLLLINPVLPEYISRSHILPIGYLSLQAWLTQRGHQVELLFPEQKMWDFEKILDYIEKHPADMIGMGGFYDWLPTAVRLSHLIRHQFPGIRQIFGGVMATPTPELCFKLAPIDFVCRGEGEIAVQKLLDALDAGIEPKGIPGICHLENGIFVDGGFGEPPPLDEIPEYDWDSINMAFYAYNFQMKNLLLPAKFPVGFFLASRGCPYKCNFCFSIQKYRRASLDYIFDRLDSYVEKFRPKYMHLIDDTFCANHDWTLEFCERLRRKNYGFNYYCNCRVNMLNDEMAAALKSSGCDTIQLALESADNEILARMNKKITFEKFLDAVKIARRHGLIPNVSAMLGQPGETVKAAEKTINAILNIMDEKNPWRTISFFKLRIYPGSQLYNEAKAQGLFKDDFDHYQRHFNGNPVWMCEDISSDYASMIVAEVNNIVNRQSIEFHAGMKKEKEVNISLLPMSA